MSKNKLKRFAELKTLLNVLQPENPKFINWSEKFGNNNPIILELACGKGEYALGLAKMFPKKNFIGIDIKGARIWRGAKTALEEKLTNVIFLRTQIENLDKFFLSSESDIPECRLPNIAEIWITFPDPFPRKRDAKRRLTSPRFLEIYKKILKPASLAGGPDGVINFKTDDLDLFNYSVETAITSGLTIEEINNNIYANKKINNLLRIQTFYEKIHLKQGKSIHYLQLANPNPEVANGKNM